MTLDFAYPSEVTRPYMPDPQKIHEATKGDLEKVGIKVNTMTKPWNGGYLDQVDAGRASMFILGWTGDYNTADNFIGTFFSSLNNRLRHSELRLRPGAGQGPEGRRRHVDEAERTAKYQEINKKIVEQYLPAVPVSHSPPALVVRGNVEGIVPSPLTDEKFDGRHDELTVRRDLMAGPMCRCAVPACTRSVRGTGPRSGEEAPPC